MSRSRVRLEVTVIILLAAVFGAFGAAVYRYFTDTISSYLGQLASLTAQASVSVIEERIGEYVQLRTPADEATPYYLEMQAVFQRIKAGGVARYIYTEQQVSVDQVEYILDAEPVGSPFFSPVGSRDNMDDLRRRAYAERKPVYGPLDKDPVWGVLITGYAPIMKRSSGEFIGLLGVDIDAATANSIFRKTAVIIGLIALFSLAATVTLAHTLVGQLTVQLSTDVLTSTFNRRQLGADIEAIVRSMRAAKQGLAVLLIDLDHFKRVNDLYGHQAGDAALTAVAGALKQTLRAGDRIYRYGGEEFVIVMPFASLDVAMAIAERLRYSISVLPICVRHPGTEAEGVVACADGEDEVEQISLTISVGVAAWETGLEPADLIRRSDEAMYVAKKKGRNTVRAWVKPERG